MTHYPCPTCGSPLVYEAGGSRFICSRRDEGCFEQLLATEDHHPIDIHPHDGPEAVQRIIRVKDRLLTLAGLAQETGALSYAAWIEAVGQVMDCESYLRLGRLRARLDLRMAQRGEASGGVENGADGAADPEGQENGT